MPPSLRERLLRAVLFGTLRLPRHLRRRLAGPLPCNDRGDLLDEEVHWMLFLKRTVRGNKVRRSPAAARADLQESARLAQRTPPLEVDVRELTLGTRPARAYLPSRPGAPVLLYLHGGGFVAGDLDSHDGVCRRLCQDAGRLVISLDYGLAPEHAFPTGLQDVLAACEALPEVAATLGGDPGRLAIGGDSAGGNLATAACLALRDAGTPMFERQLLVYPATDFRRSLPSHRTLARGYFLESDDITWFVEQYGAELDDPRGSVLLAELHDLPPAIVATAGFDPLRDEGEAYAEAMQRAGVEVIHLHEPRLVHGYLNMDAVVAAADEAFQRIVAALGR